MAINSYVTGSRVDFPTPFLLSAKSPLDPRVVVSDPSQLELSNFVNGSDKFWYLGMIVGCESNGKAYILKSEEEGFVEIGGGVSEGVLSNYVTKDEMVNVFKVKGVLNTLSELNALDKSKQTIGDVYNIRERFTVEQEKLDSNGQLSTETETVSYPAGTNVVLAEYTDASGNKVRRWDALGGISDFDWVDI